MSPKKQFFPARLNMTQRIGFFVALAISVLVLLLHFPFEGYDNDHFVITRYGTGPCPNITKERLKTMTYAELTESFDATRRCTNDEELQVRPFSEWESKGAIVPWFSSVPHAIAGLVFALGLGALWVWVFRAEADG